MIKKGQKTTVHLVWEKDTPGTYRYKEVDEKGNPVSVSSGAAIMATAYIRQSAMPIKLMKLKFEITGE